MTMFHSTSFSKVPVGGEKMRKGCSIVNIVHMNVNGKMIPVETIPGMMGGGE
jgi:hypothetical protein